MKVNHVTFFDNCVKVATSISLIFVSRKYNRMPLLNVFVVLIVVGVILWLINSYIPMDDKIKKILNAVAVIVVVIWLLQIFGILSSLKSLRI